MSTKQSYDITPLAGQWLAGRRRVPGVNTILLTDEEAEFELSARTIVPSGQPLPDVDPPPALIATDVISYTRNGLTQELTYAEFLARVRIDLGVIPTTPTPPANGDDNPSGLDLSQPLTTNTLTAL